MELNVTGQKRVTVQSNPARFDGHWAVSCNMGGGGEERCSAEDKSFC